MLNTKELLVYKVLKVFYLWFFDYFIRPFRDLVYRTRIVVDEHFWEKKLGINTVGSSLVWKNNTMFKDNRGYEPTPYHVIKTILVRLKYGPEDIFVDLGCGKGRMIFSIATKKLKKIIGIEILKDMLDIAMENLEKCKIRHTPIEIVNTDVAKFDMREGTIFFMFHPFGLDTQEFIMGNIRKSFIANPRQVRIVCVSGPDINNIDGYDKWLEHEDRFVFINSMKVDIWCSRI